jgi:hypothetical protein
MPVGSPYILTSDLLVYNGGSLTIEPGTEVQCGNYAIQVGHIGYANSVRYAGTLVPAS